MDFLKEYWYIGLGVLVLVYFAATRGNNGGSVTQIRQGTDDIALAQLASVEREADEARRYGVANSLLQYDLQLRGMGLEREQAQTNAELSRLNIANQVEIARVTAEGAAHSQELAAQSAYQLAQLQANSNNYANQLQYQQQQYVANRAYNSQQRNDWLGAITSGVQTILPLIFGNQTSGGSMNIPRIGGNGGGIYPSGSWTFGF